MVHEGTVFDIQRFSLHDGKGIRTIVFLKGCPLDCMWCSNPESKEIKRQLFQWKDKCIGCQACVEKCGRKALSWSDDTGIACDRERCTDCGDCCEVCYADALVMRGLAMTVDEVFAEVMRDTVFYKLSGGGLTLSGGEPLAQADFALALLKRAKEEGLPAAMETAGHCSLETLRMVDPYVDTYLYDVKHSDPGKHKQFTGVDNKLILSNLEWLARQKRRVIIRVPVIPNINDDQATLQGIVDLANNLGVTLLNFLPYHEYGSNKYTAMGNVYSFRKISGRVSLDMDAFGSVKDSLSCGNVHISVGG